MSNEPQEPTVSAGTPEAESHAPATAGSDYVTDRTFSDFPISSEVVRGTLDLGFRTATPVQAHCIEPALAGRDLVVRAKTGTGKTAAFCIPIIERIGDDEKAPRALVLAPTRELAQQIAVDCTALARYRAIAVATLVGGMPMDAQERSLREGASIVVGTPGRVLDLWRRGALDLSGIRTACLDEADEMLSMGFWEDVTAIVDACPKGRQILMFSATVGSETQRLIARYTSEPEHILLSSDSDRVEGIEHILYETSTGFHKVRALLYLLDIEDPHSAILFCNTREDAATVAAFLDRQGLDVILLSGELTQAQRNEAMRKVKQGEARFLAATDIAARGIDISDLSHVINYSLPQDPEIYLHRTGRTGRIGKTGVAISLAGGTDLNTRRVLENQFGIRFTEKQFPDAESCVRMRVERQAEQIRNAMGNIAFEAYLPTVRALKEHAEGEILLAAALRAFFQWDRARRARIAGLPEEPGEARRKEQRQERRDRRGPGRRDGQDRRGAGPPEREMDAVLLAEGDEGDGTRSRRRKRRRKKKGGPGETATGGTAGMDDLDSLLSSD